MNRTGFYSQPGPSTNKEGGGVGKYLGNRSGTTLPKKEDGSSSGGGSGGAAASSGSGSGSSIGGGLGDGKKKQAVTSTQFKDFSNW